MTRGRDGRPRPHRSGEPEQFHRCGDIAALQALARATRTDRPECWCSVLPRTEPVAGGKAVAGGTLLWADVDTPGTLWRARALRAAPARAPGRRVRRGRGPTRAALAPLPGRLALAGGRRARERPTPAWPSCWAATASATAGGSCACPARATSRADGRGAGVAWWRATCTHPRSRSSRSWARWLTRCRGPRRLDARRATTSAAVRAGRVRSARVVRRSSSPTGPISEYGYARCPLHDDHIPSLKLYDEPRDGWYCWACARGGDLIEYAAWRWHGRASRGLGTSSSASSSPACRSS